MAQELWPWLIGAVVLALGAVALRLALRRSGSRPAADLYEHAIERWLEGDLTGARDALRDVVRRDPDRVQPYLQLGVLLRLTGDAARAAVMHRNLAVRADLPDGRKLVVGLELATDLITLRRPQEADEVLAQIAELGRDEPRWYRLRFAVALAQGEPERADQALHEAQKRLGGDARRAVEQLRAAWLTDSALQQYRAGNHRQAARRLGAAEKLAPAEGRVLLMRAMMAAAHDPRRAVDAVANGLARHPAEMAPALHLFEGVLLEAGRFTHVIPILESACQDPDAPPGLWMALARLYEKLGRRRDALRLLGSKRGDPRLTPNAAAPYLRLLTAEHPEAAFTQVWNTLTLPAASIAQRCSVCGRREDDLRWFCPDCLSADSFVPAGAVNTATAAPADHEPLEPPRY